MLFRVSLKLHKNTNPASAPAIISRLLRRESHLIYRVHTDRAMRSRILMENEFVWVAIAIPEAYEHKAVEVPSKRVAERENEIDLGESFFRFIHQTTPR